jgi:hypothetical protein
MMLLVMDICTNGGKYNGSGLVSYGASFTTNDVIGVATRFRCRDFNILQKWSKSRNCIYWDYLENLFLQQEMHFKML